MLGGQVHTARLGLLTPLHRGLNLAVRSFQRHPFLIKTLTSGIGFAAGDALAQLASRKPGQQYDWARSAKMAAAGWVVAGPVGYLFLVWMEQNIMPQAAASKLALTTKFTLDQVLGCALWHAALLAAHEPYRVAAAGLVGKAQQALPGLPPRKAAAHIL